MEQEWATTTFDLGEKKVVHEYGMWPKQKQFHQTRKRYVLFGGARGPGKTRALCEHIFRTMVRWPGIPILLARRDLKDLKATTEVEWLSQVCPRELYDPRFGGQHHKGEHWYRFPNESTLMLGAMKDWESYKSATLGKVCFDELNEIEWDAWQNLKPTLRWTTGEGICDFPECYEREHAREHPIHPFYQMVACTNPAPGWVKDTFWTPWKQGRELEDHAFIPATAFDNPSLPPDYIDSLLVNANHTWVMNYVYGDWSAFENMVWPAWNRALHRWKDPVPFDEFVRIEGGIDYGATGSESHRTCAYLTGYTRSGKMVTFWEYSKQGEAANDFFEELAIAQKRYNVWRWQADASQSRTNELLRNRGIPVYDAPRYQGAVKDGNNLVHRLMRPNATGDPQLYVTDDCPRLMAGIETYRLDPETGQPLKNQEDDEVDAWRYNLDGLTKFSGEGLGSVPYTTKAMSGVQSGKASAHLAAFRREKQERMRRALRESG